MTPSVEPWFVLPEPSDIGEKVVVVGAGIAGCFTAFELAQRNIKVQLIEAGSNVASGASGNDVGIIKPFIGRSQNLSNEFYSNAFQHLLRLLSRHPEIARQAEFNDCGVLQLVDKSYPSHSDYEQCNASRASELAGCSIESDALFFPNGGHINPRRLCQCIVQHPNIEVITHTHVNAIDQIDGCKTLVLANGQALSKLEQTAHLPITAALGQTSRFELLKDDSSSLTKQHLRCVVTNKHYVIPHNNAVTVGATFKRGDTNVCVSKSDHDYNFAGLTELLPSVSAHKTAVAGFCGIRATTPDRFPVVGPAPQFDAYMNEYRVLKDGPKAKAFANARYHDGLLIIGGFGSRGIVSAPYCAKLLAEQICKGAESKSQSHSERSTAETHGTLDHYRQLLHPARFMIRHLKRT